MRYGIFSQLVFGYAVVLLPMVLLVAFITWELNGLKTVLQSAATHDSALLRTADHLLDTLITQEGFERKFAVSGDPDFFNKYEALGREFSNGLATLESLATTMEVRHSIAQAKMGFGRYTRLVQSEKEIVSIEGVEGLERFDADKTALVESISNALTEVLHDAMASRDRKISAGERKSVFLFRLAAFTVGALFLLGVVVALFTTRSIHKPIKLLQKKANALAGGDYQPVDGIDSPVEIAELAGDFNIMARRLKESDRMKADFVSQVSHELRTPLTSIRESVAMLLEGLYRDTPDKERSLLRIARGECDRLIELVTRLLDLSRMEAGMMTYDFTKGNIDLLVREWVMKLTPIAERKKILLSTGSNPELPDVMMDKMRIGQVLQNLIGNALKFTDEGGRVSVHQEMTESRDGSGMVKITVTDTGCGIDPRHLESIFNKFKTYGDCRRENSGAGLGLSIAKYVVAAHGGEIWVENRPENGCSFSFTLPVAS